MCSFPRDSWSKCVTRQKRGGRWSCICERSNQQRNYIWVSNCVRLGPSGNLCLATQVEPQTSYSQFLWNKRDCIWNVVSLERLKCLYVILCSCALWRMDSWVPALHLKILSCIWSLLKTFNIETTLEYGLEVVLPWVFNSEGSLAYALLLSQWQAWAACFKAEEGCHQGCDFDSCEMWLRGWGSNWGP